MAEPIEMSFQMWTPVGPRQQVLDGCAHWRYLANTTEPSMCGGDAAFCQKLSSPLVSQYYRRFLWVGQND